MIRQSHLSGTLSNVLLQANQHWRATVPQLLDTLVTFLDEEVIDFLEGKVGCLRVEEVDDGQEASVDGGEEEVCACC